MTNCSAMANKVGDVSEKATTEAKRIKFVQNPDSQLADFNKLFYHIIKTLAYYHLSMQSKICRLLKVY